jgi:transposase
LPSYTSILKTIADESLTPVIETLVAESSRPLKEIETDFAVDSTGFGVGQYYRHYSVKRKALSRREEFLKLHACVGIQTHIFAAVRVTDGHVHDMKEFQPLVNAKAEMFTISEISADKGYLARKSFDLVDSIGAAPYIAFKRTSMPNPKSPVWDRLFHLYSLNRQEFLTHYHKRSNVESAFSALKRRFADFIRAKKYPAQKNELLLKILIYNVGCVIQSMFELGIDPSFSGLPRDSVLSKKGAAWKVI